MPELLRLDSLPLLWDHIVDHTREVVLQEGDLLFLSQNTFRLLKKHTGCNFKELLGKRMLQQAAYLMSNTTQPVESVMTAIGYDNSNFFYRRFREQYGCSPKEFRGNINPAK